MKIHQKIKNYAKRLSVRGKCVAEMEPELLKQEVKEFLEWEIKDARATIIWANGMIKLL